MLTVKYNKDMQFANTRWSIVLSAVDPQSPQFTSALETLCKTYWYPLYAFIRRSGYSSEDAEDLTQEFFARLLEHQWIARVDRLKGRFRSFLLMALKRFLAKEWDKSKTLKRGGNLQFVQLQLDSAESRYNGESANTDTPDQIFEKQWALALLERVLNQLRDHYVLNGKGDLFRVLEPCLIGSGSNQPYASLATELGMTEGALKVAVSRLRERYRVLLRKEIAHTVASPTEIDEELRHLFRVLARH